MNNRIPEVPEKLDWITARSQCSIAQVFKELELGVSDDVEQINGLIKQRVPLRFSLVSNDNGKRFSVICEALGQRAGSVDFAIKDSEIIVVENNAIKIRASLTL